MSGFLLRRLPRNSPQIAVISKGLNLVVRILAECESQSEVTG
jgi:hypothetical protein